MNRFSNPGVLFLLGIFLFPIAAHGLVVYGTPQEFNLTWPSTGDDQAPFDVDFFPSDVHALTPLKRVDIFLSATYWGNALLDNDSATAANVDVSLGGTVNLEVPTGTTILTLNPSDTASASLAQDDGDGSGSSNGGADEATLPMSASDTGTVIYTGVSVEDFVGSTGNTIGSLLLASAEVFNATFLDGKSGESSFNGTFDGIVTITYYVPEPSTVALLGLASICLLRRRRD